MQNPNTKRDILSWQHGKWHIKEPARETHKADGHTLAPGLPDGVFSNLIWLHFGGSWNRICWYILCPFGIFHVHLVYFMSIWYILCPFGTYFLSSLGIFLLFWCVALRKIWQPWLAPNWFFSTFKPTRGLFSVFGMDLLLFQSQWGPQHSRGASTYCRKASGRISKCSQNCRCPLWVFGDSQEVLGLVRLHKFRPG
jgi:hypothetical protein